MAMQFSTAVRNGILDSIETTIGEYQILRIYSGPEPANCAAASTGTLLVEYDLAASGDWNAASGGTKTMAGVPLTTVASGSGIAGYARWFSFGGTVCGMQGTVSMAGLGGDVILDNSNIAAGQLVSLTGFTLTAPGA